MAHTVPANVQTLVDNADMIYDLMYEEIKTGTQAIYSGAVMTDSRVSELAKIGIGGTRPMPFLRSINTIQDQIIATGITNTVSNLQSGLDQAVVLMRLVSLGQSDLVKIMTGKDPLGEAAKALASYWLFRLQNIMNNQLNGVFGVADMVSERTLDISALSNGAGKISTEALIDVTAMLGERMSASGVYIMHPKSFAKIAKDRETRAVVNVNGRESTVYAVDGKSIVLNEKLYDSTSEDYTTYFLSDGAFALGQAQAPVPLEYDRLPLVDGGTDILISRMQNILHPVGIKFTANAMDKETPTDEELANSANWARAYDMSNILMAKLVHKV